MKRRSFVKASLLSGAATAVLSAETFAENRTSIKSTAEFYELRTYTLKNEDQQKVIEQYFEKAAMPALNKMGVKNIGVFTETKPVGQSKLFVFIPYKSVEHFVGCCDKLHTDSIHVTHGAAYLNAPATQPAYERIQSSFFKGSIKAYSRRHFVFVTDQLLNNAHLKCIY